MILKSITIEDLKPCSQYLVYLINGQLVRGWTDGQLPSDLFYFGRTKQLILRSDIKRVYKLNDVKESILWHVKLTWANKGQTGKQDDIVQANNAVEALHKAWTIEDPRDLRTVDIKWLTPTECIVT